MIFQMHGKEEREKTKKLKQNASNWVSSHQQVICFKCVVLSKFCTFNGVEIKMERKKLRKKKQIFHCFHVLLSNLLYCAHTFTHLVNARDASTCASS